MAEWRTIRLTCRQRRDEDAVLGRRSRELLNLQLTEPASIADRAVSLAIALLRHSHNRRRHGTFHTCGLVRHRADGRQTIYSIFRLRRATSKALFMSNTLNAAQESGNGRSGSGRLTDFDDQFLKTALRISTYPIALIIVNGIISGVSASLSHPHVRPD